MLSKHVVNHLFLAAFAAAILAFLAAIFASRASASAFKRASSSACMGISIQLSNVQRW